MEKYKLKFTGLQREILRLLCMKVGKKLNKRQISKLLNVSPTGVAKALPGLKNLVSEEKVSNISLIALNRGNPKVIQLKRRENLRQLYNSGAVTFLEDKLPGATIILFGSYSRGEDTINSDVDIAIIGRKEKKLDLKKFEKALEREIILNFYTSVKSVHKNLRGNIYNGIVLSGGIEL